MIREAERGDAAAVSGLLDQLGYPQDGDRATADRIRAWADDRRSAVLVASDGAGVLGVIAVTCAPFFERPGRWGRIVALVVSERSRRRGVGARLIAVAEDFAGRAGCVLMEVSSSDQRRDAHAFYQRLGYRDLTGVSTRFRREL